MRIIISPAKKMKEDLDGLSPRALPALLPRTRELLALLRSLTLPELRKLLACNEQLAALNYQRYQEMDLEQRLSPALLAYEGIQYRYMAPAVFTGAELEYVQERLRILSGFYGVLRPFDGVVPYRLEMQARVETASGRGLYRFWGAELARTVDPDGLLLNLASAEYSKAVLPYLPPSVQVVTPVFGEKTAAGKVVEKGVHVKMARGELVRFLAELGAESLDALPQFHRLGFRYAPELSSPGRPVFLRETSLRSDTL